MSQTDGHRVDCRCIRCLDFRRECCGRSFATYPAYARHLKGKVHGNPKTHGKHPKRRTQLVIVPDGLGFLISTTSTPERLQTVSLQALSRFAAALNDQRHFRSQRFTRREREILKALRAGELGDTDVSIPLVSDQALALYSLAQASNIPARSVAALLVSYGLEYLAKELKAQSAAPAPRAPTTVVREREQPNTPHEEFLAENGVTVPQRKREYLEYHKRPLSRDDLGAKADSPRPASVPGIHSVPRDSGRVDDRVQDPSEPRASAPVPTEGTNSRRYIPRAQ